ncbi:hypothetical protein Bca101_080973 [Brassica carinata]
MVVDLVVNNFLGFLTNVLYGSYGRSFLKVHGHAIDGSLNLPEHGAINAIGDALGPIVHRDVDKARLKVEVNGLKPLIMCMDIELPSKAVLEIELEYEGLHKHCFLCKSLTHEDEACPRKSRSRYATEGRRDLGISQHITLERIEENKKRQAERRNARRNQPSYHSGARWTNYKVSDSRDPRSLSRDDSAKRYAERSSDFEENRRRYDDRTLPRRSSPSLSRRSPSRRDAQEHGSSGYAPSERNLPAPLERAPRGSISKEASSKSHHSPPRNPVTIQDKSLLASRLSDPRSANPGSEERVPAKERLSVNTRRTATAEQTGESSNPRRIQDGGVFPLEDTHLPITMITPTRPSSSNVFESGRLGIGDRSPIRTLSEDRIHVSLRLGPLQSETESGETGDDSQLSDLPLLSKAEGKRVRVKAQTGKKTGSIGGQIITGKRRRVTTNHESPQEASHGCNGSWRKRKS